MSRRALGVMAGWCLLVNFCLCGVGTAAEPVGGTCSVERLRSLLQSVDPYLPSEPVSGKITIFGSSSMDGLVHAWSENFRHFHPEVEFEIASVSEEQAIRRLAAEPNSIWLLSRPVGEAELKKLQVAGIRKPVTFEVARQALAVFVHPANPITTISGEQLRAVFTQELESEPTWLMLGATGPLADQKVRIISRRDDSDTQKYLQEFVFRADMRTGSILESNANVVDAINSDTAAIGICGLRCGSNAARALNLESQGSIIPSDDLAILSGQYPLVRPLSVVVNLEQSPTKRNIEFAKYILSQSGQAENLLAGYFPVDVPLIRAKLSMLMQQYSE
jgi:phosphate transport system substrate-binding protein